MHRKDPLPSPLLVVRCWAEQADRPEHHLPPGLSLGQGSGCTHAPQKRRCCLFPGTIRRTVLVVWIDTDTRQPVFTQGLDMATWILAVYLILCWIIFFPFPDYKKVPSVINPVTLITVLYFQPEKVRPEEGSLPRLVSPGALFPT